MAINSFAEPLNALIVCLEHRFYGQSVPNGNEDIAQLRLLTSEQALEDAANWPSTSTRSTRCPPPRSGWRWEAHTAASSLVQRVANILISTPELWRCRGLQAQVDYVGYNEVVGEVLGPQCGAALKAGNDKVTELLSTSEGQAQLAKDFNLCAPLSDPLSQAIFVSTWSYSIGGMVQYAVNGTVATWCSRYMAAGGGDPYQALVALYFPQRSRCYSGFTSLTSSGTAKLLEMEEAGALRSVHQVETTQLPLLFIGQTD